MRNTILRSWESQDIEKLTLREREVGLEQREEWIKIDNKYIVLFINIR